MKKYLLISLALLSFATVSAQVSTTEIYLVDIIKKDKKTTYSVPKNITNRDGYDNQPEFSADGKKILYVSMPDTLQSDIFEYTIEDSTTKPMSETPESEYSPKYAPNGKTLAVVQVDGDKGQRLYQFTGDPQDLYNMAQGLDSVGYYTWLSDTVVALACLNNGLELYIYEVTTSQFVVLGKGIGRCLLREPLLGDLIYTRQDGENVSLVRYEIATGESFSFCEGLPGVQDYVFNKDGKILASKEGKLYGIDPNGDKKWVELADFSKTIGTFYRIAVSPDGKQLALVSYQGKLP